MTSILLSIKPEYVEKIFNRTKKYEFRKRMPYKQVDKVIVYSNAPEPVSYTHLDVYKRQLPDSDRK